MSGSGGGPPNKWAAFTTKGMTGPDDFAQALSNLWAQGFNGEVKSVPSSIPGEDNVFWVAVAGYSKHK